MNRDILIFTVGAFIAGSLLIASGNGFAGGLAVTVIGFTALWVVSLIVRNASIVDVYWGPGFIAVGAYYAIGVAAASSVRGLLVLALVTVWALRLGLHIGFRNAGIGEDFRYRQWREQAGRKFWWTSYFKVFLLQAVVLWIVSSPLLLAQLGGHQHLTVLDVIGLATWGLGFVFEAVADWQLQNFKKNPVNRGQVLRTGLWSLSRHPNYFGEAVVWWGIGLLALPAGGWLAFVGPLMITFLLLRISGVTMLDAAMSDRRPAYADYIESTPAFVPLPHFLRRSRGPNPLGT